jgi:hypothetical protein
MKIATAAFLIVAPSALAFVPGKTAFRPSTPLAATTATETKVRPSQWVTMQVGILSQLPPIFLVRRRVDRLDLFIFRLMR